MEKKQVAAALLAVACMAPSQAFARVGDVAGTYYSTDIVTSVKGTPISSINIGGQTLISAEDLVYHGFDVNWLGNVRRLEITYNPKANHGTGPAVSKSNLPVGSALGYYYETDIVTLLNGKQITAYNIGGRTYIWAEEMRDFGYRVIWDGSARTLTVDAITMPVTKYPFEGHEYAIYQVGQIETWEAARGYCEMQGGHLATISSQKENDFVYTLLEKENVDTAFFGLTDAGHEGTWKWCTGEYLVYTNWASMEPDNYNRMEHYAAFHRDLDQKYQDGRWNDSMFPNHVSGGKAFICEWDN